MLAQSRPVVLLAGKLAVWAADVGRGARFPRPGLVTRRRLMVWRLSVLLGTIASSLHAQGSDPGCAYLTVGRQRRRRAAVVERCRLLLIATDQSLALYELCERLSDGDQQALSLSRERHDEFENLHAAGNPVATRICQLLELVPQWLNWLQALDTARILKRTSETKAEKIQQEDMEGPAHMDKAMLHAKHEAGLAIGLIQSRTHQDTLLNFAQSKPRSSLAFRVLVEGSRDQVEGILWKKYGPNFEFIGDPYSYQVARAKFSSRLEEVLDLGSRRIDFNGNEHLVPGAFPHTWDQLPKFERRSKFSVFVITIARRRCVDDFKYEKRLREFEEYLDERHFDKKTLDPFREFEVEEHLRVLQMQCDLILAWLDPLAVDAIRYRNEGVSQKEIKHYLGLTGPNAVNSLLGRARRKAVDLYWPSVMRWLPDKSIRACLLFHFENSNEAKMSAILEMKPAQWRPFLCLARNVILTALEFSPWLDHEERVGAQDFFRDEGRKDRAWEIWLKHQLQMAPWHTLRAQRYLRQRWEGKAREMADSALGPIQSTLEHLLLQRRLPLL